MTDDPAKKKVSVEMEMHQAERIRDNYRNSIAQSEKEIAKLLDEAIRKSQQK